MRSDLRPHQIEGMAQLRAALLAGKHRPVLQLPTGAGKTILAAAIVEGARAKGNTVVFTVPAIELVDQTVAAFGAEGIENIGVIQADHMLTDWRKPVQIASVQTLARREHLPFASIVVVDDGPRLAMLYSGKDFKELLEWLGDDNARPVDRPAPRPAPIEETDEGKRQRMNRLWGKALPIQPTDPAGIYLASRLGRFPAGTGLRYLPHCPYPEGDTWAAALAIFVDADGTPSGLHRTYLTADGKKAPLVSPKLSLGPLRDGGSVRLGTLEPSHLAIAKDRIEAVADELRAIEGRQPTRIDDIHRRWRRPVVVSWPQLAHRFTVLGKDTDGATDDPAA